MSSRPLTKWGSSNVGFACSHATKGYGFGVAIACGRNTDVGAMTALSFKERPLSRAERHQKQMAYYTLLVVVVLFFLLLITTGFLRGEIVYEVNLSLLVALTPICLPIILYWGMRRTKKELRRKQCHVRNLQGATTVGLTTVIVTDLVGTMTKRRMRVSEIFVDMGLLGVDDLDVNAQGPRFIELIRASVLCNDAVICPGNIGVPKMQKDMYGNILDIALLKFGLMILPNIDQLRRDHEKVANKHYSSADKVQVTVHRTRDAEGQLKLILLMKGHCHVVIRRCSTFAIRDEELPLDDQLQEIILSLADGLLEAGRHVRAFAYKELSNELEFRRFSQANTNTGVEGGEYKYRDYLAVDTYSLRFLGMIATYNPPRSTIPKAVARCRTAGIKLILVTRRKRNLAKALAMDVGILSAPWDPILTRYRRLSGTTEIVDMTKYNEEKPHHQRWHIEQLLLAQRDLVCAGTSTEQLHWIVDACRRLGAVVSVVGGTLHDTPAMRSGHVGVAKYGCAVMCEASADLILLDSSFATLVSVVGDSRLLFENLKKALAYCLATNTTNLLVYSTFFLFHIPFHIHIMDELILAFLVNLLPAMALIYEPPEEKLMLQVPKVYDDFLLNSRLLFVSHILVGTIEAAAVFMTYFVFMADRGFLPRTLVGVHISWHDDMTHDITDSYGQEWSSEARQQLECQVSSLCLMSLVTMQCTNLVLTKTGRANLLTHGFDNWRLSLAVAYLICLAVVMCLLDSAVCLRQDATNELDFGHFLWTICPFVALLVFLESARRYFLRLFPDSWLELATLY
ncbi:sodium/potassium-transporting ATPase subunit alpha isoform X2 [Drosophila biarmipes]|uniref:sodium/potassium-transporting ATPase subunit alpha isoform X2 n=1 Tax=Drosophila biarmipes TaxID=125945 RepID=UPI0007E7AAEB|nr:sodium/potassium-transporting ATPase subunit alpha isoform X2 [Drosophila biarmipes]